MTLFFSVTITFVLLTLGEADQAPLVFKEAHDRIRRRTGTSRHGTYYDVLLVFDTYRYLICRLGYRVPSVPGPYS